LYIGNQQFGLVLHSIYGYQANLPDTKTTIKEYEMQEAIKKIIDEIPGGFVFDSHFVINELIKRFTDEYLLFARTFSNLDKVTLTVHGQIGMAINQVTNIEQVGKAWSENIHKTPSECTCWRKK